MSKVVNRSRRFSHSVALVLGVLQLFGLEPASAETLPAANPISATIPDTSFALRLEKVIQLPDSATGSNRFARVEQVSPSIDGSGKLFAADQRGKLYTFTPGDSSPALYFDFGASIPSFRSGNGQSGLRGFAFHPDAFTPGGAGFGKLYTAYDIDTASSSESHRSVVSEWTLNAAGDVIANSRRVVLEQSQPRGDHNIGKVAFNPNLTPSDADYGNLYISFGDGGNYRSTSAGGSDTTLSPNGQDTTNFLGSMLRINPLQKGDDPYTVPTSNPFIDESGFLPEIWAFGLRNPHQFSWDTGGEGMMLIADIGQSNCEEVNLGVLGANYGWSVREGTFDMTGKAPDNPIAADVLPVGHVGDPYTYPVVQYDHDFNNGGQVNAAIAGGYVYRGSLVSELCGKYLFGNFGTFGRFGETEDFQDIFVVDVETLQLRDDFSDLSSLDDGFLAPMQRLKLVDANNQEVSLLDLVRLESGNSSQNRADMRFGFDADGEVYVSSKKAGVIWRFVGTPVPESVSIQIERDGPNAVSLSWSPIAPGWILQENSGLAPDGWEDAPSGSTNPVEIPLGGERKFFRVIKP